MIPRRLFWLFDLLTLGLAFLMAYFVVPHLRALLVPSGFLQLSWIRALSPPPDWHGQLPQLTALFWVFIATAPTAVLTLGALGNHGPLLGQSCTRIVAGSLLAPLSGMSLISLTLFALKHPQWSRLFIFSFAMFSSVGLGGYRVLLRIYCLRRRKAGYHARNVVLIGLPSGLEQMVRHLTRNSFSIGYHLVGYLRPYPDHTLPVLAGVQLPFLGDVQKLGDLLIRCPIHEVIVVYPVSGGAWLRQVIQHCDYLEVGLRIVPEALLCEQPQNLRTVCRFDPLSLPAVVLTPPLQEDTEALFIKRLFDIVVSAVLLVLLAPFFALIALAIKIATPHLPIFYHWHVVGQNGVEFTGYKFTTMVSDADQIKAQLLPHNEMRGPVFKMKDDPRVTPLGHFLRKYSLNELPQLWSVLKGDMSLVGPRPAFRHELERYEFWHKRKLSVKPGITCLWQVRGRNQINRFDDWVKMDLEYIENWSLWLDFKILLRTGWVVIAGTGS